MRNIVLTSLNVHRILITSVLISTKVFDDEFYKNAYYAKLGGVSTSELNSLELEFLSLVNFNLFVTTEVFDKYQNELRSFVSVSPTNSALPTTLSLQSHELGMHASSASPRTVPVDTHPDPAARLQMDDGSYGCAPSYTAQSSSFFSSDSDHPSPASSSCMPFFPSHPDTHACPPLQTRPPSTPHFMHPQQRCSATPTPPPHSSSYGLGMDTPCYSAPAPHYPCSHHGSPANGLCVDQWASNVPVGVIHSQLSYPPPSHSHRTLDAPPASRQQYFGRPPPSHSHRGGGGQGHPHTYYYPPSTTTPTSVVDVFAPPFRFPSPPHCDASLSCGSMCYFDPPSHRLQQLHKHPPFHSGMQSHHHQGPPQSHFSYFPPHPFSTSQGQAPHPHPQHSQWPISWGSAGATAAQASPSSAGYQFPVAVRSS